MDGNLIVYRASAGTGKTFTLAAEYIAMLLSDDHMYRHILAVTFTNKAKEEMKERILQYLYDLSPRGRMAETDGFARKVCGHALLAGTPWSEVRRRAALALSEIVHDYDRFRVETIDSFFQSVLQNLARELGVAANFRITLDDAQVIEEAVDNLLLTLADRPDLRAWVLRYMEDHFSQGQGYNVARELKYFARELTRDRYRDHAGRIAAALEPDALAAYRAGLSELAEAIDDGLRTYARQLIAQFEESGEMPRIGNARYFISYLRPLAEGEFDGGMSDFVRQRVEGEKPWGKAKGPQPDEAFVGEMAERLAELERLRADQSVLYNTARLATARLYPLRLLHAIDSEVERINAGLDRVMLSSTPRLLRDISREDAPFVFEKSGTQFRHILIDEFQDTSRVQWAGFRTLIVENLSQGNECFLVGDVKQSIYRWRGGDASLLGGIEQAFPSARVERLDTNFRSDPAVVDFNNYFFPEAARLLAAGGRRVGPAAEAGAAARAAEPVARVYRPESVGQRCAREGGGGYVEVNLLRKPAEMGAEEYLEYQYDLLYDQICRLRDGQGVPPQAMTVLLRTNGQIASLVDDFARRHPDVCLVSEEAFHLTSSPAVMFIVRVLTWLADPADSEARAYIVKKSAGGAAGWADALGRGDEGLPPWLAGRRDELLAMPLYELCAHIVGQAGLDGWPGQSAYLFGFFDALTAFLDEGRPGLRQFLACWSETLERRTIPSGEVDGVRVMTVHKAKGLDAHTVLLPALSAQLDAYKRDSLMWCDTEGRLPAPFDTLPLVPVPEGTKTARSLFAPFLDDELCQKRLEELNTLYVAFTRARCNMFVWTELPAARPRPGADGAAVFTCGRLIADTLLEGGAEGPVARAAFLSAVETDGGVRVAAGALRPYAGPAAAVGAAPANPLKVCPESGRVALCPSMRPLRFRGSRGTRDLLGPGLEDNRNLRLGRIYHEIFAAVATEADVDAAVEGYARRGYVSAADVPGMSAYVHACLRQEGVAQWFDGSWRLYNECTILSLGADGRMEARRPDRVMTKDGLTVVVDFKFGARDGSHRAQVGAYADLLRRMGHSRVEGWLWYVKLGEIQKV